jgi:hypothetical protein
MEHHVKPTPEALELLDRKPDLGDKLALAHKFAERRLATFAEEIPQAFMVRFFRKEESMSTQLPEDEADSIQWEGGEENKGDESGETRDPKQTEVIDAMKVGQEALDAPALETHAERVNANDDDF